MLTEKVGWLEGDGLEIFLKQGDHPSGSVMVEMTQPFAAPFLC